MEASGRAAGASYWLDAREDASAAADFGAGVSAGDGGDGLFVEVDRYMGAIRGGAADGRAGRGRRRRGAGVSGRRRRREWEEGHRREGRRGGYWERDRAGKVVFRYGAWEAGEGDREGKRARSDGREEGSGGGGGDGEKGAAEEVRRRPVEEPARKYQLDVLEQAKKMNTIAFLETGAGKTLIAVLLMKSICEGMEVEGRKMLAIFLVPKVPLVYQVSFLFSFFANPDVMFDIYAIIGDVIIVFNANAGDMINFYTNTGGLIKFFMLILVVSLVLLC